MSDAETSFAGIQAAALAATRELMMSVEFAEQARASIDAGAFLPASDTEIDSAESALITVRAQIMEMEELLAAMKDNSAKGEQP